MNCKTCKPELYSIHYTLQQAFRLISRMFCFPRSLFPFDNSCKLSSRETRTVHLCWAQSTVSCRFQRKTQRSWRFEDKAKQKTSLKEKFFLAIKVLNLDQASECLKYQLSEQFSCSRRSPADSTIFITNFYSVHPSSWVIKVLKAKNKTTRGKSLSQRRFFSVKTSKWVQARLEQA